ncbi:MULTISPECIES: hypothetical protein [unclassified Nitrospina]|uniref:hypothetical protein n=1 Tax=unclassified Nitrospina TaxID=2638683 RepID=UPI003F9C37D9
MGLAELFKNLNQRYSITGQTPIPGDSVDKTMLCVAFLGKPKHITNRQDIAPGEPGANPENILEIGIDLPGAGPYLFIQTPI